jgi:hypothetical protein
LQTISVARWAGLRIDLTESLLKLLANLIRENNLGTVGRGLCSRRKALGGGYSGDWGRQESMNLTGLQLQGKTHDPMA